jgi:large subunit ribosomal protein L15
MKLQDILSSAGKNKRGRRVGRGRGSGRGKTSGRGHKGFGQRAGATTQLGFEGGQTPLVRRFPKRGFTNIWARPVEIINVSQLNAKFSDGDTVNREALLNAGLVENAQALIKVLGDGELERKLTVEVDKVSKSAGEKIAAAGGTVELKG